MQIEVQLRGPQIQNVGPKTFDSAAEARTWLEGSRSLHGSSTPGVRLLPIGREITIADLHDLADREHAASRKF